MLYYKEKNGTLAIEIKKYGREFVEKVYPLLDPDIKSFDKKKEKHKVWWKETLCLKYLDAESEHQASSATLKSVK
jgi:hypothetical protein